ncbi:hypothetical protein LSCM1_01493 [Leishmania martiniquensis]|uniref:Glycosyl transferase family 1 domain-containing protein n=1 Tax=Leishmania martiniquensis TaxID=1580590 RepID=A0A836GP91_9TRYP|nr:hypothetical protein LSCM1_01493 [Leishmania martiniquensis]
MWNLSRSSGRNRSFKARMGTEAAPTPLERSYSPSFLTTRGLAGRRRVLRRWHVIVALPLVALLLLWGCPREYSGASSSDAYRNTMRALHPLTPTASLAPHNGDVRVSLIMPILMEGNASTLTSKAVPLDDLLGPLVESEEALCYRSATYTAEALAYPVDAVVVSGAAAASPALAHALRSVLCDGVALSGDALPSDLDIAALTPAQSWRVWELSMEAVRAALRGAARSGARCLSERVTLVAPVAPSPGAAVEVLVDAALRTRGGRVGSHFVVLSSFLGATRMRYTEPGDALETRHEGTGLLDALVHTAMQRNGGRVAAAQCTILQRSGGSGGWRYPSPQLRAGELASLRVVDKGGLTGTTHDGEMLQLYLTRRLSGYSAADQRASWEEVVDAVSLHCGIFYRRLYDTVGGLAAALAAPAMMDGVSTREDHAMGAADRGGWALTLWMQSMHPSWQVWSSRATAVVRDDVSGSRALAAVASLQRPVFSLLDQYGRFAYNVLTELQRRRLGVSWRLRGEAPRHSERWTDVERYHLPPMIWYFTDFSGPCIGLSREAMGYIRPLMERYGIHVAGQRRPCPKAGDALLQLAYARLEALWGAKAAAEDLEFFRQRFQQRAIIAYQHVRANHYQRHSARFSEAAPRVYIGHSMSELSNIKQQWATLMRTCVDEIWTTAEFFATIYRRNGVSPGKIRIVPEAVDVYEYDPANYVRQPALQRCGSTSLCDNRPYLTSEERLQRYVFFSNFKWEDRKGWDVLLMAYWSAFGPSTPPELRERTTLVIKTRLTAQYAFGLSDNSVMHFIERWGSNGALPGMASIADYPHIIIVTGEVNATELIQMYANADAFVYPTKAEGWGLPAVEAMAMALPVLITEWSGPLRFMERDSCFRIPVDGLEEIAPGSPYGYEEGMKMAVPSVEKTAELMRYVVEHPRHAQRVGRRAREYAVRQLSEEAVADRMDRLFVEAVRRRLGVASSAGGEHVAS